MLKAPLFFEDSPTREWHAREAPAGKGVVGVKTTPQAVSPGYRVIYRPYITLKNGKRLYAKAYGLRAFRLVVRS